MVQKGVGIRLRLYRHLRGLTQESLSEAIGVSKQHLGQIERGECKPSLDFLTKAASALNTPVANFFLGHGQDPSENVTAANSAGVLPEGVDPCSSSTLTTFGSLSATTAAARLTRDSAASERRPTEPVSAHAPLFSAMVVIAAPIDSQA